MTVTTEQCAAALAERRLLPERRSAVYLAGSLVRGWGNAMSDVDVYVVVPEPWQGEVSNTTHVSVAPGSVPVHAFDHDGRRWDVEYWLDAQVDELLDAVSWDSFESGRRTADTITPHEIAFAQRLGFSLVVEGDDWVRRRAGEFDASAIKAMIATNALYELDLLTEDAVGMLESGDVDSAVLATRLAFGWAIEALLASLGEFNEQPKWRARRMKAVAPPVLGFDDYWAIETMRDYTPADPRAWVERVLRTCQDIVTEVKL